MVGLKPKRQKVEAPPSPPLLQPTNAKVIGSYIAHHCEQSEDPDANTKEGGSKEASLEERIFQRRIINNETEFSALGSMSDFLTSSVEDFGNTLVHRWLMAHVEQSKNVPTCIANSVTKNREGKELQGSEKAIEGVHKELLGVTDERRTKYNRDNDGKIRFERLNCRSADGDGLAYYMGGAMFRHEGISNVKMNNTFIQKPKLDSNIMTKVVGKFRSQ